jgi:FemAB-related protein (PEP-CTERM system-associated)
VIDCPEWSTSDLPGGPLFARFTDMSSFNIKYADDSDQATWDRYVQKYCNASLFHMFGWRNVFHETYGHSTYYLMVTGGVGGTHVHGVLPLVHFKHAIFGNRLVSLPFVDGGGILAASREAEEILLTEAVRLGREVGATTIELRQEHALTSKGDATAFEDNSSLASLRTAARTDKVRMLLELPVSSETLLASFKSKLRSQINRSLKEGFDSRVGGLELVDDFYKVFLVNMRDLGSPVHSRELMRKVLGEFPERSRIIVIYRFEEPVASALVVGSGATMHNPWASSLRKYAPLGPNMLLYLRVLEHACDSGYRVFDFGRSTVGEGTYKFKQQWGAEPAPLYWHHILLDGKAREAGSTTERFRKASHYWSKLPVLVTRIIGPSIRKHISL